MAHPQATGLKPDQYAGELIKALRKQARAGNGIDQVLATRVIRFLERRLTDAAKAGCHHCDERGEAYAPCWWCGLKRKGR